MNAQNNLKKPNFSKGVMGYTPSEVDRYIDHINERYNTVSREAAELKRKIINLQLRLNEAEDRLAEAEKKSTTKKCFDHEALSQIFDMLDRENSRHAQFLDLLKDKLCDMLDDEIKESDDGEWEDALDEFIDAPDLSAPAETVVSTAEDHEESETEAEEKLISETPVFMPIDEYDIPAITTVSDIFCEDGEDSEYSEDGDATAEETDESEDATEDVEAVEAIEAVEETAHEAVDTEEQTQFVPIFGTYDDDGSAKTMEIPKITRTDLDLPEMENIPTAVPIVEYDNDIDSEGRAIWAELNEIFANVNPSAENKYHEDIAPSEAERLFDDMRLAIDTKEDVKDNSEDGEDESSKTPAENLAELDFYQDDVHQDGESFDPMTLAKQVTTQRNKVTYEDFFKSMTDGNKK